MPLDPRTPVIVGVGQALRRPEDLSAAGPPDELMVAAARAAERDSGGAGLLRGLDSIRAVKALSWRYADAGRVVADAVGAAPRETVSTTTGGNSGQMLLNDTALSIARGQLDTALIVGAEAMFTRLRARRRKLWLDWPPPAGDGPTRVLGTDRPGTNEAELARNLAAPVQVYPVFESALRAASGESLAAHHAKVATLWSRFSEVAATNPYAWSPRARSAEEIGAVTPDNRMIGFPYTKLMNAQLETDQGAALLVCSAQAAQAAGVSRDRWVFPWSGADAEDHWWISERDELHRAPALRLAARSALELAETEIDDIAYVDLYSCFPSAVQIAAAELGLALERPLTLTGGLTFAGGPGNNYTTHAIAALVERLRSDPGAVGLTTGVGWYLTKHSVGVYGGAPPRHGFRHARPQAEIDALPRRRHEPDYAGPVTVEAYTVMHERDGTPSLGIVACRSPAGARAWGEIRDPDTLQDATARDLCGRPAQLQGGGTLEPA